MGQWGALRAHHDPAAGSCKHEQHTHVQRCFDTNEPASAVIPLPEQHVTVPVVVHASGGVVDVRHGLVAP